MRNQQQYQEALEEESLLLQEGNIRQPKEDIDLQILNHQREISKLQMQQKNPAIEERKKQQLHRAVAQHQREKQLSNSTIALFYQNTQAKFNFGGV